MQEQLQRIIDHPFYPMFCEAMSSYLECMQEKLRSISRKALEIAIIIGRPSFSEEKTTFITTKTIHSPHFGNVNVTVHFDLDASLKSAVPIKFDMTTIVSITAGSYNITCSLNPQDHTFYSKVTPPDNGKATWKDMKYMEEVLDFVIQHTSVDPIIS